MEVTKLNHSTALSTYADVWVLPPFNESKWSKHIDYYLNYMILKSQNKKSAQMNDNLKSILKKEDMSNPSYTANNKNPLMLAPQSCLPARQIVYISSIESLAEYVETINEITSQLHSQSVKIFIPQTMAPDDIRKKLKTDSYPIVYLVEQIPNL